MSSGAITCSVRCHRVRLPIRRSGLGESTNLSLSEDRQEEVHERALGNQRSDDQQRAHGKKGRRLDEHGCDGPVQSTESGWRLRRNTNAPAAQDEPDDDHDGEENIEGERDRMVRKMVPGPVDKKLLPGPDRQDARRYIIDVNLVRDHHSRRTQIRTHGAEVHEGGE